MKTLSRRGFGRLIRACAVAGLAAASLGTAIDQAAAFETVDGERILVIAGRQPVDTLDPSIKYNASIRTLQQALYDALVKYEGNPPEVKPWLAESWEQSEDGKT